LDCVLYGEIAYVSWNTIELFGVDIGPKALWLLGFALLLNVLVIGLFYKQFKVCSFDPGLAVALGIPVALFHYLLMGLVSVTTVASFESVGAILVVGMLVVPPLTAYLLTERLSVMILYSVMFGSASAVAGYYVATWLDASIAASMITVAGAFLVLAFLFSPTHGVVLRKLRQRRGLRQPATGV